MRLNRGTPRRSFPALPTHPPISLLVRDLQAGGMAVAGAIIDDKPGLSPPPGQAKARAAPRFRTQVARYPFLHRRFGDELL